MRKRHFLFPLAGLLAALAACHDGVGPSAPDAVSGLRPELASTLGLESSLPTERLGLHFLRQSVDAPRLETYRVSFWAVKGSPAGVKVKYQSIAGQAVGGQFLQFDIPRNGLVSGANGARLRSGDSVLITLTIDSLTFEVDFAPSGVQFSKRDPALLQVSYVNADPDLNGDGRVDGADAAAEVQLGIWYQAASTDPYVRLTSELSTSQKWLLTALTHFSGYGVAW